MRVSIDCLGGWNRLPGHGYIVRTIDQVVEQVAALLEHVAESRLGAGNSHHLLIREGEDVGHAFAGGELIEAWPQAGFHDPAEEVGRRSFESNRLHSSLLGNVDGVVQAVLDIAIERW